MTPAQTLVERLETFELTGLMREYCPPICKEAAARIKELEAALSAAGGYLRNASIDLTTGAPKKTALRTIEGGIKLVDSAIRAAKGE